jgi:glycosyltransferase involved in cell wall biosynthesis
MMPLRIGLNLLHLVPGETGGSEVYARRLVPALLEARPELELTLFVASEAAGEDWPSGVRVVDLPVQGRSRVRRIVAEQTLLPRAVRETRVSLLHNVFTTAPAFPGVPQVTTILDVIYRRFPDAHRPLMSYGMRILVPLAARRSRRVLTLSEAAKTDIVRFLGVPADRVDVTHLGPGMPENVPALPERELRDELGLGEAPIVLSLSAKRPHKNLERLLEAFSRVSVQPPPVLLITGYKTPYEEQLRGRAGDRVRFAGWVDEPTLEGLYRAATCLVFPSLAEGFGLPVLEAMRRGLPVACSDATSLPEVAGDAALYFDPTETDAIQAALERLLADPNLRERLSAAGRVQAKKFSWEATARATLRSYERALSARS